ncbi:hypothetical protein [Egicoccus halophilus]|uniref:Uncharacterized protein n=1 Tax=Egicoccus halophilus TaxID=1670830 RepID=A0A8J3A789_9ACTN|nr:hypothetical protein [Egicoccus halophilus]GGI05214.1 hypothetical protein GCM10011354_12980 [Egicoccus halophilus]
MAVGWRRSSWRYTRRGVWRALSSPSVRAAREDTSVLPATWAVDPDWRQVVDGRAKRLDSRTTIEVGRPGPWRHVDPRQVDEAWSRPGPALGLLVWGAAVGVSWWIGSSRGRGTLAVLASEDPGWRGGLRPGLTGARTADVS